MAMTRFPRQAHRRRHRRDPAPARRPEPGCAALAEESEGRDADARRQVADARVGGDRGLASSEEAGDAIEVGQRKFSMWNPSMVPIKVIMVCGIFLMLLQAISMFFKDLAKARGIELK